MRSHRTLGEFAGGQTACQANMQHVSSNPARCHPVTGQCNRITIVDWCTVCTAAKKMWKSLHSVHFICAHLFCISAGADQACTAQTESYY